MLVSGPLLISKCTGILFLPLIFLSCLMNEVSRLQPQDVVTGVRLGQMFCMGGPPFRLASLDPTPRGPDSGGQR